jgi:hypothetical protein
MNDLDRYLSLPHRKTCTFWIFSGDRHCSCGRDAAQKELAAMRTQAQAQPIEIQPMLFKEKEIQYARD